MSFPSLNATLPPPGLPVHSGNPLAHELAALVEDIQRTRDWFNTQLDAQLASLHQLCVATQTDEPKSRADQPPCSLSMATLFEAPHLVTPPPVAEQPVETTAVSSVHQAIILPPTLTATFDPELEQATLHELNNALTRAFAEISARGGMLG